MAAISGIRGMLLEEAVLYLLECSGYRVVYDASNDPQTLHDGHSGLEVRGRGSNHQIDAVADFLVPQPFSYPQRLLTEAKCYSDAYRVEIETARNAVGVLRDVSEFWVTRHGISATPRYHYQYALFSASGYSDGTERFAFAHDIFLIQLAHNRNLRPVIDSIRGITHESFGVASRSAVYVDLRRLRRAVRSLLRDSPIDIGGPLTDEQATEIAQRRLEDRFIYPADIPVRAYSGFDRLLAACRALNWGLLAVLDGRFPLFLVPSPGASLADVRAFSLARITWDENSWYLTSQDGTLAGSSGLSFDLSPTLFELYANSGQLGSQAEQNREAAQRGRVQAFVSDRQEGQNARPAVQHPDGVRLITFQLDADWLGQVRQRIARLPRQRTREDNRG